MNRRSHPPKSKVPSVVQDYQQGQTAIEFWRKWGLVFGVSAGQLFVGPPQKLSPDILVNVQYRHDHIGKVLVPVGESILSRSFRVAGMLCEPTVPPTDFYEAIYWMWYNGISFVYQDKYLVPRAPSLWLSHWTQELLDTKVEERITNDMVRAIQRWRQEIIDYCHWRQSEVDYRYKHVKEQVAGLDFTQVVDVPFLYVSPRLPNWSDKQCLSCGLELRQDIELRSDVLARCSLCREAIIMVLEEASAETQLEAFCFCGKDVYRYASDATPYCEEHEVFAS